VDSYNFQTFSSTFYDLHQEQQDSCWRYECSSDTIISLRDRYGSILARNDDSFNRCSMINIRLYPGFYFLVVSSYENTPGEYSLVGVPSDDVPEAVGWCGGVSDTLCPANRNNVHSVHPVWITLLIALIIFTVGALLVALSAHYSHSFYLPMDAVRTNIPAEEVEKQQNDDNNVEPFSNQRCQTLSWTNFWNIIVLAEFGKVVIESVDLFCVG